MAQQQASPGAGSRKDRSIATWCQQLLDLDVTAYAGTMLTIPELAERLGVPDRRVLYTITGVAIAAGVLQNKTPDRALEYNWIETIPLLPAGSSWPTVTLWNRDMGATTDTGIRAVTHAILSSDFCNGKHSAKSIAEKIRLSSRRVYEALKVLAVFKLMTIVGKKYRRSSSVIVPLPQLDIRQREPGPSSVETRAQKRQKELGSGAAELLPVSSRRQLQFNPVEEEEEAPEKKKRKKSPPRQRAQLPPPPEPPPMMPFPSAMWSFAWDHELDCKLTELLGY